uniref:Uncharacterized protein n=1 Tax=Anopheles atroparvus TaxID=41427 RepID=A0AAG5D052_ANOAO
MNLLGIVLVVFCFTRTIETAPTPCDSPETSDNVCDETDYDAYRTCIEETRVHREKRQVHPCQPQVIEP